MIMAEHVIGLSAVELARREVGASRRRYEEVLAGGVLRPRGDRPRNPLDPGSVRGLDMLAGDGHFVFLSLGPRYREARDPALCYGFLFDAESLVRAGALVGPDLLDDYESLADEIARDLDTRNPGAPASDADVAHFAALFGEGDTALLAAVREMSSSRYWDILRALEGGDESTPEAAEALRRFREGAAAIQARKRVGGQEALASLVQGCRLEILWPGALPLAWAVGRIEAGQLRSIA